MSNPVLKNWYVREYVVGVYQVVGDIYNDTKGRFRDGETIQTSKLKSIDFEAGILVTQNTIYTLGTTNTNLGD